MKYFLAMTFLLIHPHKFVEASEYKQYEMPRTQVVPILDSESGRQYELYIKLPERYLEKRDVKHPVIYFTDAAWHIEILSAATEYWDTAEKVPPKSEWKNDNGKF